MDTEGATSSSKLVVNVGLCVERLMRHPLYDELRDEESLRVFMRSHVFAVWDFQSLLKALQRCMTCVEVPWFPTADPAARRLVNEIVLDEESDTAPGGNFLSHFELYLQAMQDCGADTAPIRGFLSGLGQGQPLEEALAREDVPRGVAPFVSRTLAVAASDPPHCVAAAFAYGREEVIPGMFRRIVDRLADLAPGRWSAFQYYLERHISKDAEQHAPKAKDLVARLCGTNAALWTAAEETTRLVLEARLRFWDETLDVVHEERRRHGG
jgi:hypothetical protein